LNARFSMLFRKSESSLSVAKTRGRAAPEKQAPDYASRGFAGRAVLQCSATMR
jgi:hypothetical protein